MRSEQEVRRALALFEWYVKSPRYYRQSVLTQENIAGAVTAIEWLMKTSIADGENPIPGTLRDIEEMQRLDSHRTN